MTRGGGGGGTLFNGLCGEASPERGTVFQASGQEGVVSLVEVYERVRKSVISACKRYKISTRPKFYLTLLFFSTGNTEKNNNRNVVEEAKT